MPADVSAGLSGPVYIYSEGKMNSTMASNREFLVTFNTHYEAKSFLAGVNAERAGVNLSTLQPTNTLIGRPHVGNESFWVPQLANFPPVLLTQDQGPVFYSMNGYILGNGAPYEMCRNDPVLWYIMVSKLSRPKHHHTTSADTGTNRPLATPLTSSTCTATTSNTSINGRQP